MTTDYAWDGTPLTAGTSRRHFALTGEHAHWSILGQREMVVVGRHFVDDPGNTSKRFVEYDCRDIYTGEFLPGCRLLSSMGGTTNGDDNVLHPSTKLLPGSTSTTNAKTENVPAKLIDGDQVFVGFVEGSRSRPVIYGVLPHSGSTRGATAAQGERRLTSHMGTSTEIQQDGTYVVTPATKMQFGGPNASENLVLGQKFKQFASDLIDALLTATYPTGVGPTGPMLPPASTTIANLKTQLATLLSDIAFTQKGLP
jgi:hypothetical protein